MDNPGFFARLWRRVIWRRRLTKAMRYAAWYLLDHRDPEQVLMERELADPKCRANIHKVIYQGKKLRIVGRVDNPTERLRAFGVSSIFVDSHDLASGTHHAVPLSTIHEAAYLALNPFDGQVTVEDGLMGSQDYGMFVASTVNMIKVRLATEAKHVVSEV